MSSAEFAEWLAYQRLDGPLGPARDDWRSALVASVVANVNRNPKKRSRPYSPSDFIPDYAAAAGVPKPPPTPQEVAAKVRGWAENLASRAKGLKR
jgi:hypothetical protein